MAISDHDYNQARAILANAGSNTARNAHQAHTQGAGSPDGYGRQLLREARDEFRQADAGLPNLVSEMTQAHYDAIHQAADAMGLTDW